MEGKWVQNGMEWLSVIGQFYAIFFILSISNLLGENMIAVGLD